MAWTKVAQTTFTVASGTGTESKTLPGSPQQNDIVIVCVASDVDNIHVTAGQGYTVIGSEEDLNPSHEIAAKRMGASPDTSVEIDQANGAVGAGLIQIWRGADTTTFQDMAATTASGASGNPNPPSATTVTDGALVIAVGFLDDDDVASSVTAPTGYSNLLAADTGQSSTTVGCTVMIASLEKATAGAEDPGVFGTSGSDAWQAYTFALRPAGDVATSSGSLMLLGVGS
jgi:hypothetical protein